MPVWRNAAAQRITIDDKCAKSYVRQATGIPAHLLATWFTRGDPARRQRYCINITAVLIGVSTMQSINPKQDASSSCVDPVWNSGHCQNDADCLLRMWHH